jgi:murein DD-endopeptidase MepM/ murein hydrolase activator NlpD
VRLNPRWRDVGDALRKLNIFSEHRELILRSSGKVLYIPMPRAVQVLLLLLMVGAGGLVAHVSLVYFRHYDLITGKEAQLADVEVRNEALLARMGAMRNQFSDVAGTLERNHRNLIELVNTNTVLQRDLKALKQRLRDSEAKRAEQTKHQIALNRQMIALESQIGKADKDNSGLNDRLERTKSELTAALMDRSAVESTRDWLKMRVKGLEEKLTAAKESQDSMLVRMTRRTARDIDRAERIIAATGLKVAQLLKDDAENGAGGPFIPLAGAGDGEVQESGIEAFDRQIARWERLRDAVHTLPLVAPLEHYKLTSGYGLRKDPMNGKSARHEGLDLSGPTRSPVFSTAPGKVEFSGWKGKLGRLVVVDHGNGVKTRYGHLRRIYVKRGQTVEFGQKIGQLGSSGRSTGPHVHYEIIVHGRNVDPEKFLKAGRDVFKG